MNDRERSICSRVRHVRESLKWSQVDFAKQLGISRDKLASIEYGRTPLNYAVGYAICRSFDLCPKWLVTGGGDKYGYPVLLWTDEQRSGFVETDLFSSVYDRFPGAFQADFPAIIVPDLASHSPEDYLLGAVRVLFRRYRFRTPVDAQRFAHKLNQTARGLIRQWQHSGRAYQTRLRIQLTARDASVTIGGVKSIVTMEGLRKDLRRLTQVRSKKAELLNYLGVPRESLSRWLSGEREPGGETTLQLLHWVEQQERNQK